MPNQAIIKKAVKEWSKVPASETMPSYCFTCNKGIVDTWYHRQRGHKTTHTNRASALAGGLKETLRKPARMVVIGAVNGNGTSSLNRHIGYFAGIVEAYAKQHNISGSILATGVSQFISEKGESS